MPFITAIINYSAFSTGINCGRAEGLPCGLTLNSTLAVWPALSEFCQGRIACTDRMPHDTGGICCNDVISFFLCLELVEELCPSVLEYMHLINMCSFCLYIMSYILGYG